jgi:glucose uptake protein GlcU
MIGTSADPVSHFTDRMIVLMTLLIASMAFAVHQWWRGHPMMAIGFITFACLIAGAAIEAAKNNHNAEATEVLR